MEDALARTLQPVADRQMAYESRARSMGEFREAITSITELFQQHEQDRPAMLEVLRSLPDTLAAMVQPAQEDELAAPVLEPAEVPPNDPADSAAPPDGGAVILDTPKKRRIPEGAKAREPASGSSAAKGEPLGKKTSAFGVLQAVVHPILAGLKLAQEMGKIPTLVEALDASVELSGDKVDWRLKLLQHREGSLRTSRSYEEDLADPEDSTLLRAFKNAHERVRFIRSAKLPDNFHMADSLEHIYGPASEQWDLFTRMLQSWGALSPQEEE